MIGPYILSDAQNTPVCLRPRRNGSFLVRHSSTRTNDSATSLQPIDLVSQLSSSRMLHSRCLIIQLLIGTEAISRTWNLEPCPMLLLARLAETNQLLDYRVSFSETISIFLDLQTDKNVIWMWRTRCIRPAIATWHFRYFTFLGRCSRSKPSVQGPLLAHSIGRSAFLLIPRSFSWPARELCWNV